jgi:hypothetical protein
MLSAAAGLVQEPCADEADHRSSTLICLRAKSEAQGDGGEREAEHVVELGRLGRLGRLSEPTNELTPEC